MAKDSGCFFMLVFFFMLMCAGVALSSCGGGHEQVYTVYDFGLGIIPGMVFGFILFFIHTIFYKRRD